MSTSKTMDMHIHKLYLCRNGYFFTLNSRFQNEENINLSKEKYFNLINGLGTKKTKKETSRYFGKNTNSQQRVTHINVFMK